MVPVPERGRAIDILQLPTALDLKTAAQLHADLLSRRGQALELDASGVERIGGLGLQVLLAAQAAWTADGMDLRLGPASEEFKAGLAGFGAAGMLFSNSEG
ncbi:STAS domain-containing protein [Acidisoma sp. C75]